MMAVETASADELFISHSFALSICFFFFSFAIILYLLLFFVVLRGEKIQFVQKPKIKKGKNNNTNGIEIQIK